MLGDGTTTYLYGAGRIGQHDTAWTYPLGDALGSVRQLSDAAGTVILAQNYAPYGETMNVYGTGTSNYGFAGEWTDSYIKLIYLRSRYYAPATGRFLTKDVWQGDYTRPLSLNKWMYVEGNPVNYTDPSGMCRADDQDCLTMLQKLVAQYSTVNIDDSLISIFGVCSIPDLFNTGTGYGKTNWELDQLKALQSGLGIIEKGLQALGSSISSTIGTVTYTRVDTNDASHAWNGKVYLSNSWATDPYFWSQVKNLLHETGHVISLNFPETMTYFMDELGSKCIGGTIINGVPYCIHGVGNPNGSYDAGPYAGEPWNDDLTPNPGTFTASKYATQGNYEDFAETFITVLLHNYMLSGDMEYRSVAFEIFMPLHHSLGKRQFVMEDILSGKWKK